MRIALVTPILPIPLDQTRGRFIHETAKSLSKLAKVKVFFQQLRYPQWQMLGPRTFIPGHVGSDYQAEGIDVEASTYPAFPLISRAVNGHVSAAILKARIQKFQPDLVLAYWVYPDGYAALRVARSLGVPCVLGALGSDIHVRSGVSTYMTRKTLQGAQATITVSEAMRQTTIKTFGADPSKVHTIVNGFNTAVFHPRDQSHMRAKLGVSPDEKLIIYVGRFIEAKGLRELIQAFKGLAAECPNASLALIGDGVMKPMLEELIAQTQLKGRIHLPGGQPPDKVAEWICASDVLTLPSWSEGYPNVVVEGVACGRPVVATDVGGTSEIVNKLNGILIPAKDPQRLQEALRQALTQDWDHAAIASASMRTWDDVAQETLQVCQKVLR
jgi:teichuronic acid biosynthesis glycosyltransferase TuaC